MQHARDSSDTSLFPVLFSHSLYRSIINLLLNKLGFHLRRQLCFRRARLPLFNEDGKKNSELNLSIKLRVTSSNAMHWFKTQTFNSSAHINEDAHGMMKGKAWTQQQNVAIRDDTTTISRQSCSWVQTWRTHVLHPSPSARRNIRIQYYSSDILHSNTENWDISAACFQEKQHTECVSLSFEQPVCCSTY